MLVTDWGMFILARSEHNMKAPSPMEVTLWGIVTVFMLLHSLNILNIDNQ